MNDCVHWFTKLLQVLKEPQQLKHKVFFPFSLCLAKTGDHCSSMENGLWLKKSVRKTDGSNCLQHSFIKHWYSFYGFGHLLQLKILFLVFPFRPFYLPVVQFKIYFHFLSAHKEVWSHLQSLRKHWMLGLPFCHVMLVVGVYQHANQKSEMFPVSNRTTFTWWFIWSL